MREVDRLKVIEAVAECRLKPDQAAERLSLSERQVKRLVLRYRAAGVAGLVSDRRGRPSNHQLPAGKAQRVLPVADSRARRQGAGHRGVGRRSSGDVPGQSRQLYSMQGIRKAGEHQQVLLRRSLCIGRETNT
ncbi:helix-turn-helix domain-containing protein [Burkholderia sp. AW50-3]